MDHSKIVPLVPASKSLPEITIKSLILAVILTLVLTAANAFLGLKVGATVSASIPAAVISLGILGFFKNHNVLESTMVQTAASAGEGLVAGIAFVLPALLSLGYWHSFHYGETVFVAAMGGIFGVLFSVPIRRALLNDPELRFPEGVAIGNVLKASASDEDADLKMLVVGGVVGGLISLFQTGFRVVCDSFEYWWRVGGTLVGVGSGFSPALIAAGYIVGVNVGLSMFVGVIIGWFIGVPVLAYVFGVPEASTAAEAASFLWNEHMRYLGVGAMLVGGIWTLLYLCKPVLRSLKLSLQSVKNVNLAEGEVLRTEKDIPMNYVLKIGIVLLVPIFIFGLWLLDPQIIKVSMGLRWALGFIATAYVLVVGFAFSSIAAYFAGLIGSSNSPGSGLTVSVLLFLSLLTVAVLGAELSLHVHHAEVELAAAGFVVLLTSFMSAAIVISNETIQDLKVGQILGATPWKQQVMLVIGVIVAALIIPLILELLFNAYGMAGVYPREGMDPSQMLPAPQAGLMAAIVKGAFSYNLPWGMISIGVGVGVVCIVIDELVKPFGVRLPVLAVGLGIYLPVGASIPVVFGGLLNYLVNRHFKKRTLNEGKQAEEAAKRSKHLGLTLACGLVAGASLMGVVLAIPFAMYKSSNVLSLVGSDFIPYSNLLAVLITLGLCTWIYRKLCR
jgi:putative OPT family oligopeptide transporter